jgi:tyrosine-protein kinase Etk/Wzc
VEDAVIRRLALEKVYKTKTPEDTRRALEASVKMQADKKDGIISIVADDKDPKRAAAIANAFVEELFNKSVQLNLTKAGTERSFLEKRLEVVRIDLKNAEDSMRSFQEKNKAVKVDSQAIATIQGIAQMKAELISKEVQLATLRSYQTDENPQVRLLQSAISRLRGQLGEYEGSGMGGDAIPSVGNLPNLGLEYARRLRELKIQELLYEQLTKQYEMAKLNEAKDSSALQVLDDAVVPAKKSGPKRSLIVILSTIIAFFVGVFIAFFREYGEKMPAEDMAKWMEIKSHARLRLTAKWK